jgi:hypothetical protein
MFDNNSPEGFKEFDDKYGNVFLFEPNLYLLRVEILDYQYETANIV